MVFLSFNPSVSTADEIGDEGDACTAPGGGEAASAEHPLRYRWIVWQQLMASGKAAQYSEATRQVASCGTVEEFWGVWGRLPQPSELLGKAMVNDAADSFQTVDALMLFRDGIMPQWEDEANAEGGHFQLQLRPALGGGQIDEYWNNIVLGVVGATIEPPDMITGLRLVDKLSAGRGGTGHLRIEVWFGDLRDVRAVQALQLSVERCLSTKTLEGRIGTVPKLEMKNHKLTRHQ